MPTPLGPPTSPARRVFIVEPNPIARAQLAAVLEHEGYAVTAVASLEATLTSGFWNGDPARLMILHPPAQPRPN